MDHETHKQPIDRRTHAAAQTSGAASSKPTAIPPQFDSIPVELRSLRNWILWRYEPPNRPDNPKWRKVPCNVNGDRIDAANRNVNWTTFDDARAAYQRGAFDGIGFAFDGEIGPDGLTYIGIDFDHCYNGDAIVLRQQARIKRLDSYTELSPGGSGCHCICRGKPLTLKTGDVEIYSSRRYFTFTGRGVRDIRAREAEVQALAAEVRMEQVTSKQKSNGSGADADSGKVEMADAFQHLDPDQKLVEGIEDNHWFIRLPPAQKDEVVDHALGVIAANGKMLELNANGGSNDDWYKITTAVARSGAPKAEDIFVKYASQATDADPEDALRQHFRRCEKQSPSGFEKVTVGTLLWLAPQHGADFEPWRNSAAEQERRARQVAENIKIGDDVTEPLLPQIMTLQEMKKRLVFIGSIGAVADRMTGRIRTKEHAVDEYAASLHTYLQDNGKPKRAPALNLWIASTERMTVEVLAWVPGQPQICQPPEGPGPAFNMWRGLPPMAYPDDWEQRVEPFLEHVDYLVPVEQERERFLQWLAHIVQVPEVLPHTAYLMTTPVTGIGRNLLASILVRVLRGFVAAGVSLPDILDGGFTGRLGEKLLVIVDEAREGSGERRYQRATRLTSLLNEEHREINPKYGHRSIQKNCGRWLMFSNYDDAIPFDTNDRRIEAIANPTERKKAAYYERLYGLLNSTAFIGSVRHWLETKDIAAFRPGEHAHMNDAKLRILGEMTSETERAVAEFKEDCGTELTWRDAIKAHAISSMGGDNRLTDMHLTHAIRRAGMVNTGRRIRACSGSCAANYMEKRFTVVIVRGAWTADIVKKADAGKLLEVMGLKDWTAM
jgi:primase-polymerase (primpol)-like protein